MHISDRAWRVVLYIAAATALGLGVVEAFREARLSAVHPPGTPPPAFTALRAGGQPFSLSEVRDRVVLLSFWATWCGPCRRELPVLQRLEAEFRDRGVTLVAANLDEEDPSREEAVTAWLKETRQEALLLVFPTGETAHDWRAGTLPTLYVLGRDGRIVASHTGLQPEATLRADLDRALGGVSSYP